ncbi:hypothetical protein PYCC9005_003813 [Savitreella phatthalungensis]
MVRRKLRLLQGGSMSDQEEALLFESQQPRLARERQHQFAKWLERFLPRIGLVLSLAVLAAFGITGWHAWESNHFCLVLDDDFMEFNSAVWLRESELGGFGTGEFEWTTTTDENSFVKDGRLHLLPSIDPFWPPPDGTVLNLTSTNQCTSIETGESRERACIRTQNLTTNSIIPPLRSARLSTRLSSNIKYGRVEVRAKLPIGDWLWPAIWMMPVNSTYGGWPRSGEIDILESRGNGIEYRAVNAQNQEFPGGHNTAFSTLHWGPGTPFIWDAYLKTTNGLTWPSGSDSLTDSFHTFGLEWTPRSIHTYIDRKLTRLAYFPFPTLGFWAHGQFDEYATGLVNPWVGATGHAPFDQAFYLIINLAVGATNGYFKTKPGVLPWDPASRSSAMQEFMASKEKWLPSWKPQTLAFQIDRVRMWKLCTIDRQ